MSIASTDRSQGFSELLEVDGETVQLGATSLTAIVNRGMSARAVEKGRLEFLERSQTVIEFLKTAVATAPRVGQSIRDADRNHHRIQVMKATDLTYWCQCEEAEVP